MSLIIKDHIRKMFVGYPTKDDKYNVSGGILSGSNPAKFGDLVCFDGDGYFRPFANGDDLADIAGFILATNIKQAEGFATNVVQVNPGEAFNLAVYDTYMCVELKDASASGVTPKGQVYFDANGKLTASSSSATALTGVIFTGVTEVVGAKVLAEIYIK